MKEGYPLPYFSQFWSKEALDWNSTDHFDKSNEFQKMQDFWAKLKMLVEHKKVIQRNNIFLFLNVIKMQENYHVFWCC